MGKQLGNLAEVQGGTRKTIKPSHYQGIAFTHLFQTAFQVGALP